MKCKKCGNEVDIGEVFCQRCGMAIQIVPDYNPLEDEIEANFDKKPSKPALRDEERRRLKREQARRKRQMQRAAILGGLALCILVISAGIYFYIQYTKVHSFDYQYQLGMEYYQKEEYGSAIKYFSEALSYDRNNVEARLAASEAYSHLGDYDRTVELLLEVVNIDPNVTYYKKLMEACELADNTELMNRILKENQNNAIGQALRDYQVGELTVSLPAGEYHDYLELTLQDSQGGAVIYYTLDGSEPTEASNVYTGTIRIETVGKTTLRAVAVNEAGLKGEELNAVYTISLVVPDAPLVSPDSGKYSYPQSINVEVPEGATAYYTVDGSIPAPETSAQYESSIGMPIGNTVFSAIIVDKYGVASLPMKKNYECTIDRAYSYDAAVIKLKNYLVSINMMSDLNGNRGNGEKIAVQFVSLSTISEEECYVFNLRRTVNNETTTLSDKLYAVTTAEGVVHPLVNNGNGSYSYAAP